MDYSIVIPVFNESDKITATLTNMVTFMRSFTGSFEIIPVDDGSKDNSADIIEEFAKENPEIKLIRNIHKGKGCAVYTGMMAAEGNLIYMADADLSAPMSELKKLSIWITDQDYDVVVASREGTGALRVAEPFYRHLMGRVFNFWVQVVALPGIKDSQCGFKLFKKEAAKAIFSKLHVYGPNAKEITKPYLGAFDVEVLYLAKKLKFKVREVPVVWTFVKTTRLNPIQTSYKMAMDVLKVRLNDLKGVYSSL